MDDYKIAQVVVTQTISGRWKIVAMSLKATQTCHDCQNESIALACIEGFMREDRWEQLSLDL